MTDLPEYLGAKRDRYGLEARFKTKDGAFVFVREAEALMKETRLEIPAGQDGGNVVVQAPNSWGDLSGNARASEASRVWRALEDVMGIVELYGGTSSLLT